MDTPEPSDGSQAILSDIEYAAAQENRHLNVPEEWEEADRDKAIRALDGPFWGAWLKKQQKGFCKDKNCPVKKGKKK